MTILGISVGTDRSGVCVLRDGVLLDIQVHSFQTLWSEKKLHKIINRFRQHLHAYSISAVIVKIPPLRHHTPAMAKLLKAIELLAKEYYADFDFMTTTELKGYSLMRKGSELIEYARRLYPELSSLHERGKSTGHRYYKKMYEATLSAHIYQERQRMKGKA